MTRLVDLLPPGHPLKPAEKAPGGHKPPVKVPMFLTKTVILPTGRVVDTQEPAGEHPQEILDYLYRRGFKMEEVSDLIHGIPMEASDTVTYKLETRKIERKIKRLPANAIDCPPPKKLVDKKEFGQRCRAVREKAGLTQRQLANHMGYTDDDFVGRIERGIVMPTQEQYEHYVAIGLERETDLPLRVVNEQFQTMAARSAQKKRERKALANHPRTLLAALASDPEISEATIKRIWKFAKDLTGR